MALEHIFILTTKRTLDTNPTFTPNYKHLIIIRELEAVLDGRKYHITNHQLQPSNMCCIRGHSRLPQNEASNIEAYMFI